MSEFKQHESCPSCGSKDNLARYTDGHAWCFGCGHYEPVPMAERIKTAFQPPPPSTVPGECQALPSDIIKYIPAQCWTWLKKYDILESERKDNLFGWSENTKLLIMPVYSGSSWVDPLTKGRLLMWQGRYFGPNDNHPKYLTRGYPEQVIHIINDRASDTIVLTEDLISAIKVGRQFTSMPLWGSNLSLERIMRLSRLTKSLVIWLDADKFGEAQKYRSRASQFIPNVHVIQTPKDPKEYSDDEIYMAVTNKILGGK